MKMNNTRCSVYGIQYNRLLRQQIAEISSSILKKDRLRWDDQNGPEYDNCPKMMIGMIEAAFAELALQVGE
jgi:hypothetical protein